MPVLAFKEPLMQENGLIWVVTWLSQKYASFGLQGSPLMQENGLIWVVTWLSQK